MSQWEYAMQQTTISHQPLTPRRRQLIEKEQVEIQHGRSSSMTAEERAQAIWRGCQALLRIAARAEQVAEQTAAINQ
jgi:hypothetical protein